MGLILTGAGCSLPGMKSSSSSTTDGGVWKTINAGTSFTQVNAVPGASGVGSINKTDITRVVMDPHDDNVLYATTKQNGLVYSEDAAATWRQPRQAVLRDGRIVDVAIHPKAPCTIYVATPQRLTKSETCLRDLDEQTYVENRSNVTLVDVEVDWYNPSIVWLGLTNGDILKSTDAGKTWRSMHQAKEQITQLLLSKADSRILLAATDKDGIWKTTDGGQTWAHIEDQLKDFRNGNRVFSLVSDATSATIVAATQYGLLRSIDVGSTWESIPLLTAPGQVTVKAVSIDPLAPKNIAYAAAGTFYRSSDAGVTWTTSKLASSRQPTALTPASGNWSTMYLAGVTIEK